ncbi:hypothetical protein RUND412_008149, partial [Rhizina undulata]
CTSMIPTLPINKEEPFQDTGSSVQQAKKPSTVTIIEDSSEETSEEEHFNESSSSESEDGVSEFTPIDLKGRHIHGLIDSNTSAQDIFPQSHAQYTSHALQQP